MDYKDLKRWVDAFPELPYPGETKFYSAFGIPVSASDLGNLNYGAVGKAIGFQEGLLLQQAGAAQLQDHKGMGFLKAQWESLLEPYYGDQWDDQEMIKNGFAITIE